MGSQSSYFFEPMKANGSLDPIMPKENYICPICLGDEEAVNGRGNTKNGSWVLDHCHETGEFRGWLCKGCNTGLGGIGDNFDSALNALIYLSKFKNFNSKQLTKLIEERMISE